MRDQIYTSLHKLMELYPSIRAELETLTKLPHYVLSGDLVTQLSQNTLHQSLTALRDAGLFTLPFPRILVEAWAGQADRILTVMTQEGPNEFRCLSLAYIANRGASQAIPIILSWADAGQVLAELYKPAKHPMLVFDANQPEKGMVPVTEKSVESGFKAEVPINLNKDLTANLAAEAATALSIILMLPHISGLEREVVEPTRLNRARTSASKPHVPNHTLIRLGHVYDREGRAHRVGTGTRHMPIHMRAAHTRRQHHAPQFLIDHPDIAALPTTTADHHLVLIPAVMVNYKEGTDLQVPLPKIVRY